MSIKEISNYTCVWDMDDHKGFIGLFSGEEYQYGHEYTDPAEFTAVLDLLRHEKPLYFDPENKWISAGVRLEEGAFQADKATA